MLVHAFAPLNELLLLIVWQTSRTLRLNARSQGEGW
jgi:hypothetical protein